MSEPHVQKGSRAAEARLRHEQRHSATTAYASACPICSSLRRGGRGEGRCGSESARKKQPLPSPSASTSSLSFVLHISAANALAKLWLIIVRRHIRRRPGRLHLRVWCWQGADTAQASRISTMVPFFAWSGPSNWGSVLEPLTHLAWFELRLGMLLCPILALYTAFLRHIRGRHERIMLL